MAIVFLGLGSNLGDRQANLEAAIDALGPKVRAMARSPIYETEPWGYADQPKFLNQVVQGETELIPEELLKHIKEVEGRVGRTASFRYGPREIDIDILLYDDLVLETPELTIPHPRLDERAFMLMPLADLAGNLQHPVAKETFSQLLAKVEREGIRQVVVNER